MAILEAALGALLEGQGRLIGIVGEAGVGKSRLCHEFLEKVQTWGIRAAMGGGVSHGKLIPMLACHRRRFKNSDQPRRLLQDRPTSGDRSRRQNRYHFPPSVRFLLCMLPSPLY